VISKTRTVGWVEADDSRELPMIGLKLILQVVEKPLVMSGNKDLAITEHRGDNARYRPAMIGIIGRNDIIERNERRSAAELL
jgi:hypothetical protein